MHISLKSFNMDFYFEVDRRISFVMGDSATGKTTFYDMLDTFLSNRDETVICNSSLPVKLISFTNTGEWGSYSDCFCIVDDLDVLGDSQFLKFVDKRVEKNLWFIIMSREDVDYKTNTLTFSTKSLFRLIRNGTHYSLELLYKLSVSTMEQYDCVVVEDRNGGYEFFGKLFKCPVYSSNGKGSIIKTVEKVIDASSIKSVLVIFDNAGFGCHYQEFYNKFIGTIIGVDILGSYECFEELLLCTNMLQFLPEVQESFKNLEVNANKYLSWEKYFESLIEQATRRKAYKYEHGSCLRDCYLLNCKDCKRCNEFIRDKCDYNYKTTEKFEGLLRGSKYAFLLESR